MATRTALEIEEYISKMAKLVGKTEFAHNIVGFELNILQTTYGYTLDQIKSIVKKNKLDKKGWGYVLNMSL